MSRVTFAGSIKEILNTGPQVAAEAAPSMVRNVLTQTESNATTEISIPLKMRDFDGLQKRISEGEIIPLDEIAAEYYPTASEYKTVADWLTAQGLAVKAPDKYNLSVFASGSVAQIERVFATKFARVMSNGVESSSAVMAPSLPAAIAEPVLGVNGLQPQMHPKPHSQVLPRQPQSLTNNLPPYKVGEIAKAYNANGLSVNGNGQKIAIVIDTFPASSDLTSFWQANGIAQSLNNIEKIQAVSGTLPPPSLEATLDVEWSSGMAPGAKVRVYATTDLGFSHLDQAYQRIINDLPAQPTLHQVSLSYGLGETYESITQMQTDAQYFATLTANGVTVFVSSGDGGSSPGLGGFKDNTGPLQVECPANDPSVTSVGGTSIHLTASTGTVSGENAWSFGGGGNSQVFARPAWQTGAGVPAGSFRTVPDVALAADINTAGYLVFQGQVEGVGGTSWSAPTWAAFSAMINQARANLGQPSVGLLGPKIYPLTSTNSFRHITTGNNGPNGIYAAGPAYSRCTGLGVPSIASLIQALTGPKAPTIATIPNPADFNGDGKQDLLWRNTSTGQVGVWLMNGSTPTAAANIGSPALSWTIINTGDFNGDGKSDILWQFGTTGQYGVWFMNGTQVATIQNLVLPSTAGQICCVADFDGDGLADLVTFNRSTGTLYLWRNNGSLQFTLKTSYAVSAASGWLPIGAVRLNGPNTSPALIWRNASSGQVSVWFMTSFVWSSSASFGNPGNDVVIRGFGDLTGDGKADLLLFDVSKNMVEAWQSNGAQQPTLIILGQAPATWAPVVAENLDGTVNAEVILRQSSTGTLTAWQGSGSNWSSYMNSLLVGPAWQLQPQGINR